MSKRCLLEDHVVSYAPSLSFLARAREDFRDTGSTAAFCVGRETARRKINDGEGVIGLAWAFLAADCPAEM